MIIHLISGPRNISTALMYSFAQRPDTKVVDEPFYAFYLINSGLNHPGREQILSSMEQNPEKVFDQLLQLEKEYGNVFVKNMGHHVQGYDFSQIKNFRNVFLVREPGQMLVSYAKVREQPTLNDIGIKHQADLFDWLQTQGQEPIVLDGNEIRKNPAHVLQQLCDCLDIPFTNAMLSWPAGPRPEDGIWAPYWYANVHQSTKFMPPDDYVATVPPGLQETYTAALPHYEKLKKHVLLA